MKKKFLSLLMLISIAFSSLVGFAGCDFLTSLFGEKEKEFIDYVAATTLDLNSETLKQEVTVYNYIDGDTTHFDVPTSVRDTGVLKARYLACNTPESTGKIEKWGKKASKFTRSKLETAAEIIVESNDGQWNFDSTGERNLVWVWYKDPTTNVYRNLNLELLQEGLAVGSKVSDTRYAEACTAAIAQAKEFKLNVFSDETDPDFYYGDIVEVDIKELRTNLETYDNTTVAFEGIVVQQVDSDSMAYVEQYDAESDMAYGMYVFYSYNDAISEILSTGNRVRVVGSLQNQENWGWQISDLSLNKMKPNDPHNVKRLDDEKHEPCYKETTLAQFNSKVTFKYEDEGKEDKTFTYSELCLYSSISMKNLKVTGAGNPDKNGEFSLYCKVNGVGQEITIRVSQFTDAEGNVLTKDYFLNKTIDIKGIVEYFKYKDAATGSYQIAVHLLDNIVVH